MVGLTESLIYSWFGRSHIEYRDLFMRLYVSYNAWYQKITGKTNDYEAMSILKTRFVIWDEYQRGVALTGLRQVMIRIVMLTRNTPLNVRSSYWNGVIKDSNDWIGLISFWYEVRCGVFHGAAYAEAHNKEVQLAYESLHIFMEEIIRRMKSSFQPHDLRRLEELRVLSRYDTPQHNSYVNERVMLHQRYIESPELWNVDMKRSAS